MLELKDVTSEEVRLDYHTGEDHISIELHHAQDWAEGCAPTRMDVHRLLFIDLAGNNGNLAAAEDAAEALCNAVNADPDLLAKMRALALATDLTLSGSVPHTPEMHHE